MVQTPVQEVFLKHCLIYRVQKDISFVLNVVLNSVINQCINVIRPNDKSEHLFK